MDLTSLVSGAPHTANHGVADHCFAAGKQSFGHRCIDQPGIDFSAVRNVTENHCAEHWLMRHVETLPAGQPFCSECCKLAQPIDQASVFILPQCLNRHPDLQSIETPRC